MHIRNLKQTLNHRLVFKIIHRVIKYNQNTFQKPYINMNQRSRKRRKK